jgi:carboxylesterase
VQGDPRAAKVACLLLHGLYGSPYDFKDFALHLQQHGITPHNLLLPGHDIHHRQAARFGWQDWLHAAMERFDQLARHYHHVAIVGHSMGGALALTLAARDRRVAGIATICAPAELHPALPSLVNIGRYVMPYIPILSEDISDHVERRLYRRRKVGTWAPVAPVHTLLQALPRVRAELAQVVCPALVVAARRDHVVPMRDGLFVHKHIGSTDKELIILERSWHVVMRDVERESVSSRITAFLDRLTHRSADASQRLDHTEHPVGKSSAASRELDEQYA